jgi:hypothetical protein
MVSIYNKFYFVDKKDFIRILNEEISRFDFLGNEKRLEEQEVVDLMSNEDFQKQFICDSLLSINDYKKTARNSKIKINVVEARVGGDWEDDFDDASHLTLDYYIDIEYKFDEIKEPVKFTLIFDSEKINISKGGYYTPARLGGTPDTDREAEGDAYYDYLNWNDINVTMWTPDGDEIDFLAFKHAPRNIQTLFIKEYTEDYITGQTMPIERNGREFTGLSKSPYC